MAFWWQVVPGMVGGEGNLLLEDVLRQKKGTETDCFIVLEAPEDQKCHSPNIRTISWKKIIGGFILSGNSI